MWVVVDLVAGITSVSITRVASSLVRSSNQWHTCLLAYVPTCLRAFLPTSLVTLLTYQRRSY